MPNEWMKRARCRDMDPELFFDSPGNEYKPAKVNAQAAKACSECRVRDQCYLYALRHEAHGYWAGTTPPDRRKLRKAAGITLEPIIVEIRQYQPHGTEARYKGHRRIGEDPCDACKAGHAQRNNPEGNRHLYTRAQGETHVEEHEKVLDRPHLFAERGI